MLQTNWYQAYLNGLGGCRLIYKIVFWCLTGPTSIQFSYPISFNLFIPGSRLPESSIIFPDFILCFVRLVIFDNENNSSILTIEKKVNAAEITQLYTILLEALINIFLNAKWHRNFLSKIWHLSVFLFRLSSHFFPLFSFFSVFGDRNKMKSSDKGEKTVDQKFYASIKGKSFIINL